MIRDPRRRLTFPLEQIDHAITSNRRAGACRVENMHTCHFWCLAEFVKSCRHAPHCHAWVPPILSSAHAGWTHSVVARQLMVDLQEAQAEAHRAPMSFERKQTSSV